VLYFTNTSGRISSLCSAKRQQELSVFLSHTCPVFTQNHIYCPATEQWPGGHQSNGW